MEKFLWRLRNAGREKRRQEIQVVTFAEYPIAQRKFTFLKLIFHTHPFAAWTESGETWLKTPVSLRRDSFLKPYRCSNLAWNMAKTEYSTNVICECAWFIWSSKTIIFQTEAFSLLKLSNPRFSMFKIAYILPEHGHSILRFFSYHHDLKSHPTDVVASEGLYCS